MNKIYVKSPLFVMNKGTADKEKMGYIPIAGDIVLASPVCKPKWGMMDCNANYHPLKKSKLSEVVSAIRSAPDDYGVLLVTTEDAYYGAIALFYKGVLKALRNYWLIPSSVHEWLAVPKSMFDRESLTRIIREVNKEHVSPSERLSDRPYVAVYKGKWTIEEA